MSKQGTPPTIPPRVSEGAWARKSKAAQKGIQREMRADVLKIMRRMRQRIADKRWSGVPA